MATVVAVVIWRETELANNVEIAAQMKAETADSLQGSSVFRQL